MPSSLQQEWLSRWRSTLQRLLCRRVFYRIPKPKKDKSQPTLSVADQSGSKSSVIIARELMSLLPENVMPGKPPGGFDPGTPFERVIRLMLTVALNKLAPVSGATLKVIPGQPIADFAQYEHLAHLDRLADEDEELASVLGREYMVKPDIVVYRKPWTVADLNRRIMRTGNRTPAASFADASSPPASFLLEGSTPGLLHASVSCKVTIRSDRAQNVRLEATNMLNYRKARAPHIVVVTAEPLPSRLSSIAMGTGQLDCVYHVALDELRNAAVAAPGNFSSGSSTAKALEKQERELRVLIDGGRIRDISSLPLDLLL